MEYNKEYFDNLEKDEIRQLQIWSNYRLESVPEKEREKVSAYKAYTSEKKQTEIEESKPRARDIATGAAISAINIPTFGFGEEAVGGLGGAGQTLIDKIMRRPTDLSQNVGEAIDYYRGAEKAFRETFPFYSTAQDVGVGVGSGLGIASKLPQGIMALTQAKSPLGNITKQSLLGGGSGALYDIGISEGTIPERADLGTVQAGVGGALLSPVLQPFVRGGSKALEQFSRLRNAFRDKPLEDKKIRETITPIIEDLGGADVVGRNIAEGKPMIVQGDRPGDLAYSAQSFLAKDRGITGDAMTSEKASTKVRNFLREESENVVAKTHDDILKNIGAETPEIPMNDNENILTYIRRVNKTNLGNANNLYEQAKINRTLTNKELESARKWANDKRIIKIIDPDDVELISSKESLDNPFSVTKDGTIEIKDDATLAELEQLRSLFDDYVQQSNIKISVRKNKAKELREIIDKKNPNLVKARSSYRIAKELSDIDENAGKLFRDSKFDEFEDYFSTVMNNDDSFLTEAQKLNAFRRNAQYEIDKGLKNSRNIDAYIKSLSDPNSNKLKLLEIVYPEKQLEKIIKDVDKSNRFLQARAGFGQGSDTFFKLTQSGFDAENLSEPLKDLMKRQFDKSLTDEQVRRVGDILISDDPSIIEQLRNPQYEQYFAKRIQALIPSIIGGETSASFVN